MIKLVFMSGLGCFGNISGLFLAFGGLTGCGSASLKLCACDAAYPWSQSSSTDSQCFLQHFISVVTTPPYLLDLWLQQMFSLLQRLGEGEVTGPASDREDDNNNSKQRRGIWK